MQSEQPLFRAALNLFCAQRELSIDYHYESLGTGFLCRVSIESLSFSTVVHHNIKSFAANLAAFEYLKYLFQNQIITESELSQPEYNPLNVKDSLVNTVTPTSSQSQLSEREYEPEDTSYDYYQNTQYTKSQQPRRDYENRPSGNSQSSDKVSTKRQRADVNRWENVPLEYRPKSSEFFYPQAPPLLYAKYLKQDSNNEQTSRSKVRRFSKKPKKQNKFFNPRHQKY